MPGPFDYINGISCFNDGKNGQYKLNGNGIGQIVLNKKGKPKYNHYNSDGVWGAFWNLAQLWALVYPDYFSQYVQSNIDFSKETGWLHDGVAAGAFTNGVQTNFQGLLMAAAYNCGIRDFDIESGYKIALKNEIFTPFVIYPLRYTFPATKLCYGHFSTHAIYNYSDFFF